MNFHLIGWNALGVSVSLLWIGFHYLKALGNAFGNANPAMGAGDVAWVFVVVVVATVVCVVVSAFMPEGTDKIIALIPIGFVLLGEGYIQCMAGIRRHRHRAEVAAGRSARQARIQQLSKDYVLKLGDRDRHDLMESFLTHDRELETIVRIDVGFGSIVSASCVGKLRDERLELFKKGEGLEDHYKRYLDGEGKSIFDKYETSYKPAQERRDYHLDKYDF